jgi:hypothetical protein
VSGVIAGLLDRCWAVRLSLTVKGDALHVDFDRDHPPTDLIEEIRQYKPEVMAALLSEPRRRSSEYKQTKKGDPPRSAASAAKRSANGCLLSGAVTPVTGCAASACSRRREPGVITATDENPR